MNSPRSVRAVLSIGTMLVGVTGAAGAPAAVYGPRATTVAAPIRPGLETLIVAEPSARVSPAWRLNLDLADKAGLVPEPTGGYTVSSRVIVETIDAPAFMRALARRGANRAVTARAAGVRGYTIIETGSVAEAIALAGELRGSDLVRSAEVDLERPRALRGTLPNDPLFVNQWHLRNTSIPDADVNAEAAWAMGYTGLGITIGVTEGGFQTTHPDLAGHFSVDASQSGGSATGHATSVAGVFGAIGNNAIGVTGLAYDCLISSQLIGSASQTAAAFTYRNDLNDVKNNSWGPFDTGQLWDEFASSIELDALRDSAQLGRGGLGTITCWAAGNGGGPDRVDYDPFTSSRFTFAIGAVGDLDREASYNEMGSSMLAVTHSSGNNRSITTTTAGSNYTSFFGGTSSASPLGAGAVALALQANPLLTWRDVQALIVETARMNDPLDTSWTTNAAGHAVSYKFGFGAIDAGALVAAAEGWVNLPPETSATSGTVGVDTAVPDNDPAGVVFTADIAENITIESVVLNINLTTTYVGDLRIIMTSPEGTESVFMVPHADPSDDISGFDFMSLRSWGESSAGTWTVRIADEKAGDPATWQDFSITVYGTERGCNAADIAEPFGQLDLGDISLFVGAFINQQPEADIAEPAGVWDLADVQAFVSAFSAGCP